MSRLTVRPSTPRIPMKSVTWPPRLTESGREPEELLSAISPLELLSADPLLLEVEGSSSVVLELLAVASVVEPPPVDPPLPPGLESSPQPGARSPTIGRKADRQVQTKRVDAVMSISVTRESTRAEAGATAGGEGAIEPKAR